MILALRRSVGILLVLIATTSPSTVWATSLVSNLGEPLRAASPIGNPGSLPAPPIGDWSWAAQSFSPDNNAYPLASIQAIVGDGSSTLPLVVAELHQDNAGTVGTLIITFTAPSVSGAASVRTFLPDNPLLLLANTPYWFVLGSQNSGTYFWSYAEGNGSTGPGALLNYAYSADAGGTWADYGSDNPFYLQVNVNAVPEPTTILLLATGLVGLLALGWRHRQRAA